MAPTGRDVGVVLSGGGTNGALLELGFLERPRESPLWERVGWIYGTSAGALTGAMATLDRRRGERGYQAVDEELRKNPDSSEADA